MKDREQEHARPTEDDLLLAAVHLRDPVGLAGEQLGGEVAERRDDARLDQLDLPEEVVVPFYIVCDESSSMIGNGGIEAINLGLPELHATIAADPLVSEKCRIGLISFSEKAEVLLPIARLSDVASMPGMRGRSVTSYGAAFELLRTVISADIATAAMAATVAAMFATL